MEMNLLKLSETDTVVGEFYVRTVPREMILDATRRNHGGLCQFRSMSRFLEGRGLMSRKHCT